MHRRAIVLAFLLAALEVLAFSFVKCNSSEAFRSMCRRHEYACVSCLCMSCVVWFSKNLCCLVLGWAVLCCRIVSTVDLEMKCVWCLACCVRRVDPVLAMRRHFHERVLSWTWLVFWAVKWVCELFSKTRGIVVEPLCLTKSSLAVQIMHVCLSEYTGEWVRVLVCLCMCMCVSGCN